MSSFFESFKPFDVNKLKPFLKMAVQRIQIATNKKTAAVKMAQREVANLLAQQKDEKAAIKVEAIIREDATIEAYGILELICDLLHERARLIAAEKECPEDLKSAVHTLIWATNRADITELHEVKKQFVKKFGQEWVERAEKDEDRLVNERVSHKLSIRPPSAQIVEKYLREIAQQHNIEWTPNERADLTEGQKAFSAMPAPTGNSVGMAPASGFSHLYTATGQNNGGAGTGGEGAGGGGGSGGGSVPIARPVSPPPLPAKQDFLPQHSSTTTTRIPSPLPVVSPLPPRDNPPAVTATAVDVVPLIPSAPSASLLESPPPSTATAAAAEETYTNSNNAFDIPTPPSSNPLADLPPAPSSRGESGNGGGAPDVDDLLSRFNRLQGK